MGHCSSLLGPQLFLVTLAWIFVLLKTHMKRDLETKQLSMGQMGPLKNIVSRVWGNEKVIGPIECTAVTEWDAFSHPLAFFTLSSFGVKQ